MVIDTQTARTDFSHLRGPVAQIALRSDEARIDYIRADRWIGYPRARQAVAKLDELMAWPKRQRMPNLAIVGPTNMGKSMTIERFSRKHGGRSTPDGELVEFLSIQMPAVPTVARVAMGILDGLNAPFRIQAKSAEIERTAMRGLLDSGIKMIIIDEFHNILAGTTTAQRELLNLVRYIGNELQIPLVVVGTKEVAVVLRADPQLENRFEPFALPAWSQGPEYLSLVASFVSMLPLRRPSEVLSEDMGQYLLARTEGTTGELCQLLVSTAVLAIETGEEAINAHTLGLSPYSGPSIRRQQFER
jgi:hypothetical protein